MALVHTVVLTDLTTSCLFLLFRLKPRPALSKTQLCDARTVSKLDCPLENLSTVFKRL